MATANGRIYTRPLSYDNASLAVPKELIIDYVNKKIYISDENGDINEIVADASEIIEYIIENPESIASIEIDLDSGGTIALDEAINDCINAINNFSDEKVTNTPNNTTKAYLTGTTSVAESTGGQIFDTTIYIDTVEGQLVATTFKGNLDGAASKLSTSAGSTTQPVYFSNGVPVNTTYTLGASVPSNAKFTDTTYSLATTSTNGLMSSADKTKLDGIATGANNYTLPSATADTLGGVKIGSNITNTDGVLSISESNITDALGFNPMSRDAINVIRANFPGFVAISGNKSYTYIKKYSDSIVVGYIHLESSTGTINPSVGLYAITPFRLLDLTNLGYSTMKITVTCSSTPSIYCILNNTNTGPSQIIHGVSSSNGHNCTIDLNSIEDAGDTYGTIYMSAGCSSGEVVETCSFGISLA